MLAAFTFDGPWLLADYLQTETDGQEWISCVQNWRVFKKKKKTPIWKQSAIDCCFSNRYSCSQLDTGIMWPFVISDRFLGGGVLCLLTPPVDQSLAMVKMLTKKLIQSSGSTVFRLGGGRWTKSGSFSGFPFKIDVAWYWMIHGPEMVQEPGVGNP